MTTITDRAELDSLLAQSTLTDAELDRAEELVEKLYQAGALEEEEAAILEDSAAHLHGRGLTPGKLESDLERDLAS